MKKLTLVLAASLALFTMSACAYDQFDGYHHRHDRTHHDDHGDHNDYHR